MSKTIHCLGQSGFRAWTRAREHQTYPTPKELDTISTLIAVIGAAAANGHFVPPHRSSKLNLAAARPV